VIQAWEIVMNWLLGSKARVGLIAVLVGLSQAMHANAQTSDGVGVWVQVTPADQAPVQNSATGHPHYLPARGPNEAKARKQQVVQAWQNFTSHAATTVSASSAVSGSTSASLPPVTYPADLSFLGGTVVRNAVHHAIYMLPNGVCPVASCWGNPEGFLSDLSISTHIHITDQYVGTTDNNRYPVGQRAFVSFEPPRNFSKGSKPFTEADMQAVVHKVASQLGLSGYGQIYHVFLPQGTDVCFTTSYTPCYSPDNLPAWFFCAWHGSTDFADIGHVLYTVEPYQNIQYCNVAPGPNGTITDPDVSQAASGWFQKLNVQIFGNEIADECQTLYWPNGFFTSPEYFGTDTFSVEGRTYAVQTEYNNARHACTMAP